jgi:hypothetical protein
MAVELSTCHMCGKILPKVSMSTIDDAICARCASKAIVRAEREDGSWLEEGLTLGILHWEQFINEPRQAFNLFVVYRDLYPKQMSPKELSALSGYGVAAIRHWMQRWKWKERFFEWSKYQDKLAMVEQAEIRTDMNDRQILAASDILKKAMDRLAEIDISELTPMEALKWIETAAKLERTAIDDNRAIVEAQIEANAYSVGNVQKAEAATADKGLEEILAILQASGAINISTVISTPQVVEVDAEEVEYSDAYEEEEEECQD